MANQEQLEILKKGIGEWNEWRKNNPEIYLDLSYANLKDYLFVDSSNQSGMYGINLKGVNLQGVDLSNAQGWKCNFENANLCDTIFCGASFAQSNFENANLSKSNLSNGMFGKSSFKTANLSSANLSSANFFNVEFIQAILNNANLSYANLERSNLMYGNFVNADLSNAKIIDANLANADFSNAILKEAFLSYSDLTETNFRGADLSGSDLTVTSCVQTIFENANINNSRIYGASVWNLKTEGLKQNNLIFSRRTEAELMVDDIEVAQFIYLILNNNKIRNVLGTIANKGVLILGRFTSERKKILDAIRDKLRHLGYLPMMFDFEKVSSKDFTETIKILAGMSRFVIADISNPSSSPLELQATLPDYKIPFVPIIEAGQHPFAMFKDLTVYPWCLDVIQYDSEESLIRGFQKGIIDRAIEAEKRILEGKTNSISTKNINEFL
ncbi:pentapeptide repeat-containing protein [Algoriphagus lutimaris]|uniref:pentapeptide repeat-containing protein n=1 Tax=Algoriphagus lutimaris TaxID=613197 RepID=UPI00196A76DE|nr:pentapeptide repeat-containing protein [Algoriphagus lutimaris]MBN3519314.1 pentapeptide repeat-containing protein [Algoriphagus lutimaris]